MSKLNWKMKILCFFLALLFCFSVSIAFAPLHKMQEFENLVKSDSLFSGKFNSIYYRPDISLLVKEKAYKEALLKLSELDSIQMAVNLFDSTVNLSIRGVPIFRTKARTFKKDKLFEIMPLIQQVKLFSQPLSVNFQYATIEKEPIIVRYAPKNTSESAPVHWLSDTLVQDPVFLILSVEHGIHLIFEQDSTPAFHDKWIKFNFYNKLEQQKDIKSVLNFVNLKKQEYHPTITIKIPVDDLKIIYRALPQNAFVVIRI